MDAAEAELQFLRNRLGLVEKLFSLKQKQLNALREVTEAINKNIPIQAIARIYENVLQANMGIKSIAFFLRDPTEESGWTGFSSLLDQEQLKTIPPGQILSEIRGITPATQVSVKDALQAFAYLIPVFHKEQPIGLALAGSMHEIHQDTEQEQLKFVQAITSLVATANENKILFRSQVEKLLIDRELALAGEIQSYFVPEFLNNYPEVQANALYKPHKNIGGDYYDLIRLPNGSYLFCIADISGKGIPAALLMANFQATLNITAATSDNIIGLMESLNTQICRVTRMERFITVFIAIYHPETRILEYVNAGHNPPLLINRDKKIYLESGCMVLGINSKLKNIKPGTEKIDASALLFMYTDGATDATDFSDELYEADRLENAILSDPSATPEEVNRQVMQELEKYTGASGFNDDVTLFSIRIF